MILASCLSRRTRGTRSDLALLLTGLSLACGGVRNDLDTPLARGGAGAAGAPAVLPALPASGASPSAAAAGTPVGSESALSGAPLSGAGTDLGSDTSSGSDMTGSPPQPMLEPVSPPIADDAPDAGSPGSVDIPVELPTCVFGPFAVPQRLAGGPQVDYWAPALSVDGLTLYLAATTADAPEQIFFTTRMDRSAAFLPLQVLPNVNSAATEGGPIESFDGLALYFYSTRPGVGDRDIWRATRQTRSDGFAAPALLNNVNSDGLDQPAWVSADQLALIFSSSRAGGAGSEDLWVARRASLAADFVAPVPLAGINTPAHEGRATLSRDELSIIFTSNRPGGGGVLDLWSATRPNASSPFGPATNLAGVNSAGDDLDPHLTQDGRELYFASNRGGRSELWLAVRDCQ
ncbi:MAG: hypothetical protein ABI895_23665 [Deltaproteobacteria bacterium]